MARANMSATNGQRSACQFKGEALKESLTEAEMVKVAKAIRKKTPNPLNIDLIKLEPEARYAWEHVYALRGEDINLHKIERTFSSAEEILMLFELFCNYIRQHNFAKEFERPDGSVGVMPIIPSVSNLARWLGVPRTTINKAMDTHATENEFAQYKTALADILSEGAMMGVYQSTMTIFSLKNLCDWADKYEDRPKEKVSSKQTLEEAQRLMDTLGYKRLIDG